MDSLQPCIASALAGAAEEALLERSIGLLSERFGVDDWIRLPGEQRARKSRFLRLRSRRAAREALLKCYEDPRSARLQGEALANTRALLDAAGPGFDVPELFASFPEHGALLLEWVPARQLEQVLVRAALRPGAHWRAIRLAGRWLRRYHDTSGIAREPFRAARYAELLERRLETQPRAAMLLGRDPLWNAARERLHAGVAAIGGRMAPFALAHGDFTSTNLLIGAGRVTGIDLWAERRAPVLEDLARMCVYLAMGDPLPLTARVRPRPPEVRRAQRALFEGYGEDVVGGIDGALWRHVLLFEALARWGALATRLAERPSFSESWKRGGLRALVRALLRD